MSELRSLLASLRSLPHEKRAAILAQALTSLPDAECDAALHDWEGLWARPGQMPPPGNWRQWLILSGRGWGKTRVGAQWTKRQLEEMPGCRVAIVARTIADARDTCVEGESGLLSCFTKEERAKVKWNRSLGEGALPNGSMWHIFTSEKPGSLRGPQFHVLWADEMAAWEKHRTAWDQVPYIVRLPWHADPSRAGRVLITTTPRPVKEVRDLMKDPMTVVTRGTSWDNWANLNALTKAKLERLKGTREGRQEINGELLDDSPGALWTRAVIERQRVATAPELSRIVVAVDPATTSGPDADQTGIIAAGLSEGRGKAKRYVLADRSLHGKPHEWASAAIELYRELKADCIVVEANNGGEMCKGTLHAVDDSVPVEMVWASRGKHTRAEPVATSYEAGEIFHVGRELEHLEDELCTWFDGCGWSPNRLDAGVWALSALAGGSAEASAPYTPQDRPGLAGMET